VSLTTPNHPIFDISTAFHIFIVNGDRDLVGRKMVASASPWMGKQSLKGAWLGHVHHLSFGGHQPYLWNGSGAVNVGGRSVL